MKILSYTLTSRRKRIHNIQYKLVGLPSEVLFMSTTRVSRITALASPALLIDPRVSSNLSEKMVPVRLTSVSGRRTSGPGVSSSSRDNFYIRALVQNVFGMEHFTQNVYVASCLLPRQTKRYLINFLRRAEKNMMMLYHRIDNNNDNTISLL
jgi:hypothetical protein